MKYKNKNRHTKAEEMRGRLFYLLSAVLVLVTAVCITMTVKGSERRYGYRYDEKYFDRLETEYKSEITQILNNYGLPHSGLNLTKVTLEDGTRQYSLFVYDERVGRMERFTADRLLEELRMVEFPEQGCAVSVSFGG